MIRRCFSLAPVARISNLLFFFSLAGPAVQIISPYHLYLNPKLVVQHYEIWRLVTNFLYFRKMGMRSVPSILASKCDPL
jgi:hypothetical protein